MEKILYKAIVICDSDVYQQFNGNITEQLTLDTRNTVLHVIAQHHGSPDCVRTILIDQSKQVVKFLLSWKNLVGDTALCIAARNGHIKMVELLIEMAQQYDKELEMPKELIGTSQLHGQELEMREELIGTSQLHGQELAEGSLTRQMLRMANENGDTPLHEAAKQSPEIVKLLVEADPHFEHLPNKMMLTPLYIAMENMAVDDDYETFGRITESILSICTAPGYGGPDGKTVLHAASAFGYFAFRMSERIHIFEKIHEKNPKLVKQVDDQGFTPLHQAIVCHDSASAQTLIKMDKSMIYVRAIDDHDRMTPFHLASRQGNRRIMELMLEHCPDCWDMTTSDGRNVLHLAADKKHTYVIKFILGQPWCTNLLNQVDKHGNTPLHLVLSPLPESYIEIKDIVEHPKVDRNIINMDGYEPVDMAYQWAKTNSTSKEQRFIFKKLGQRVVLRRMYKSIGDCYASRREKDHHISDPNNKEMLEEMRRNAERHLVVAALIATVTFAAGFTLPGGYDGNSGPNQGMAVSIKKAAFKTFVITNTLAVISSYAAIFLHFAATFYKNDKYKLYNRYELALVLLLFSMVTMVIAFITGMFTVLDKSLGLAVTVCIIGSLGILFLLFLVHKTIQDLRDHNNDWFSFRPLGIEV